MKFISAGHCNTPGPNYDPGAPGVNKRIEANETVLLRDAVIAEIKKRGYTDIIQDLNSENRHEYFKRIKTGPGSVVVEFHFNAGPVSATGTEALVAHDANSLDYMMATEFAAITSRILDIKNRGVKPETSTRHRRLGLMRESGIVVMMEVCFINNKKDMYNYDENFDALVSSYADIIIKYDSSNNHN